MAYVCYGKITKKKQREIDQAKRATWGCVSPVTKKIASEKLYNRKKAQRWQAESPTLGFCFVPIRECFRDKETI